MTTDTRVETDTIPEINCAALLGRFVFELPLARIGIELTLCVVVYMIFFATLPWTLLEVPENARPLLAWFSGCGFIALIDFLVVAGPLRRYRQILQLELSGAYGPALLLLESIAPKSGRLVTLPKSMYHYRRAQIYAHAAEEDFAQRELVEATNAGLGTIEHYLTRTNIFRSKGECDKALAELQLAECILGVNAIIKLEEAILLVTEKKDFRAAKKCFEEVLALPNSFHVHGETTYVLAASFWEVTRLWTGQAEEGLEGLNDSLINLKMACQYMESMRPMVSSLLLERSYYLVTHKEPQLAKDDLHVAISLCNHAPQRRRAAEIEEEFSWRYPRN